MDYRQEFADFEDVIYLNAAGQGPLPLAAARAARQAIEWKKLPHRLPEGIYFDLPDRVRGGVARLIGAAPEEIAVTTGASAGLCAVAAGMEWRPGDEVLVPAGEFPAHFSAWLPYEAAGFARVRTVAPRGRFLAAKDFLEEINGHTRLVSASLVRFDDASWLDARCVAEACQAVGAALLLDASQCAGAMPIRVADLGADFLVCAGYKWLLSPYGTGFFWARREWSERLRLGPLYWMALEGAHEFHELPLQGWRVVPGARRWDAPETASFSNLAAMEASLEFLERVGTETIAAHNERLIERLIDRIPRDRCVLASPREPERRGPFVCLAGRTREATRTLYQKLCDARIVTSLREGALRIAPHLYNTERDIDRLISVLSV